MTSRWLPAGEPRPGAAVRLFCLPFAGGTSALYRSWAARLPDWVATVPVELPGRGALSSEAPHERLSSLVEALQAEVGPELSAPCALFGHGMGALIAFEWIRSARRVGAAAPIVLIVSGCPPPRRVHAHVQETLAQYKASLIDATAPRDVDGLGAEDAPSAEEAPPGASVLDADQALLRGYRYLWERPLTQPLFVFGGRDDGTLPEDLLRGWADETHSTFHLRTLPGDHLYLRTRPDDLLASLLPALERTRLGDAGAAPTSEPVVSSLAVPAWGYLEPGDDRDSDPER